MPRKHRIETNASAPPTGTYSQAIRAGGFVFLTGMTGRCPDTGEYEDGVEAQTHRTLSNIDSILNASGCRRDDIVRTVLIMRDIADFKLIDRIYAEWLPGRGVTPPQPARTAFQAGALPHGAELMIEITAVVPD